MSQFANAQVKGLNEKIPFEALAQQVLSLDAGVEWVALEEAGREPRWAWRDPETGCLYAGTTTNDAQVVDPLLLMLAEGRDEVDVNPCPLLFVVLAYSDIVQIIVRLGTFAHVSVAVSPGIDAYVLGARLSNLLDRCARPVVH